MFCAQANPPVFRAFVMVRCGENGTMDLHCRGLIGGVAEAGKVLPFCVFFCATEHGCVCLLLLAPACFCLLGPSVRPSE